jgi:hypothetical protein
MTPYEVQHSELGAAMYEAIKQCRDLPDDHGCVRIGILNGRETELMRRLCEAVAVDLYDRDAGIIGADGKLIA